MKKLIWLLLLLTACTPTVETVYIEIAPISAPTRQPNVFGVYVGDGKFDCISERDCLHEVGHAVNEWREFPSDTEEFHQAVEKYVEENRKPSSECHKEMVCLLQDFPGIAGNPMRETKTVQEDGSIIVSYWGGYREAYADIYAQWKTWSPLPEELQPFYHYVDTQNK